MVEAQYELLFAAYRKVKLGFALKLYIKGLTCAIHLKCSEYRAGFALILVWYISRIWSSRSPARSLAGSRHDGIGNGHGREIGPPMARVV